MRKINRIIIHCSATKEGQNFDVEDIRRWHLANGWKDCGYHFVITLDGRIQEGRAIEKPGAHTKDFNKDSIGVCYIGGCDKSGKPKDTRTDEQKNALYCLIKTLMEKYGVSEVKGHRDYSKDLNGDGIITPNEWEKACPCFDVQEWMKEVKNFRMPCGLKDGYMVGLNDVLKKPATEATGKQKQNKNISEFTYKYPI